MNHRNEMLRERQIAYILMLVRRSLIKKNITASEVYMNR